MESSDFQPVFRLSRGGHAESLHFGAIAIVEPGGRNIASLGDPEKFFFPRSSAKAFQAMPLLEAGGIEAFGLSDEEIALICSSHSGADIHFQAVAQLQSKIGISEADLLCGTDIPFDDETAERMLANGEEFTSGRHNCSGKHSGMLALAKLKGWDRDDYVNPNHPVQIKIQESFSAWTDIPSERMALGVDGCSAPNYAVPLKAMALAYARLMDPSSMSEKEREASGKISRAMRAFPEMVAGPGSFDTALMQATKGRLLSKQGAEGYQAIGIPKALLEKNAPACGVAIKIADGDARGWAASAVAVEVLRQLGALGSVELLALENFGPKRELYNQNNILVGEAIADFELERH